MTIVIKDIDEGVYTKFKAKAALKGLCINKAITEAMLKWLEEETADSASTLQDNHF